MKIFVLEHLIRQTHKTSFSRVTLDKIYNELENLILVEKEGYNSLRRYLDNQHGKEMQGSEHIWKYRLTDGDRILYTWGEYLPYIHDSNSLVLLAYATHDKQGRTEGLLKKQDYTDAKELVESKHLITEDDIADLCNDELEAFLQLILENSYHDSHSICVVDDETLQKADIKDLDKLLSKKQGEIIDTYNAQPQPTLILGGAGTGKTLLAVHLLNDRVTDSNKSYSYFTQSRALLNKVESQFKTITHEKNIDNVHFYDINEFCLKKLNLKRSNFIETPQFLDFARNSSDIQRILKKNKITELDLWTEIRGVIKGLTNPNWTKTKPFSQQNYKNGTLIKELDTQGLLFRNKDNPQLFTLTSDYDSIDISVLSQEAKLLFKEFETYTKSFDTTVIELSFENYESLPDELTMIESEKRKAIYEAYEIYRNWLYKNSFFDDNDIALQTIKLVQNGEMESFDFTVVDEVQDYTEIQIYLLKLLTKDEHFFVLAGDVHQIINPTVFNERKLMRLFKSKLNTEYLDKNFRCQQKIVEIGNKVAQIRQEKIAKGKHETPEYSEKDGKNPSLYSFTENNIKTLAEYLLKFPGVAILVPEENTKQELISLIGRETYKNANNTIIYTISEIKGMEYKYVVSYNMLSTYSNFWHIIMNENAAAKVTRYRYYFNLFYVSITRAMEYLCLIESDDNNEFYESIKNTINFTNISAFSRSELSLDILSNDGIDWLSDAEDNEKAGNYEKARESYINAGADIENLWRCDAEISVNNHDFDSAVKFFILLDNRKRINQYFEELSQNSNIWFLARTYLYPEGFSSSNGVEKDSIIKWTDSIFENNESEDTKYKFIFNIITKLQPVYERMAKK